MTAPHARTIDRDTVLCVSLSARPSNFGTRFHNHLFAQLGLNYVYKAFAPVDIANAVAGIRGLPIRGAAVSMPFKEQVIELVDELKESAAAIESVNTIVNDDGVLRAYNTDYQAVVDLLAASSFDRNAPVALAGSGGMAKAVVAALKQTGFTDVTIVARNEVTRSVLADKYGYAHTDALSEDARPTILVNATPIGMAGANEDDLPFAAAVVDAATGALDVVAMPSETPLVRRLRGRGVEVISGDSVVAGQAVAQFVLYTGRTPTPDQVAAAAEYARE